MTVQVVVATEASADDIAAVAARTFPLACPPGMPQEDIERFIDDNLSPACFAHYLVDPTRRVFAALSEEGRALGYAMTVEGVLDDADVQRAVTERPAIELSKMYAVPELHGQGVAASLMQHVVAYAAEAGARCVWLGVNQQNVRAQRFYSKHGFTIAGTKTFRVGRRVEADYVMTRPVNAA